jgi:adenylate cyclase
VDQVVVKNRQEAVTVFEVLDYYTEETFPNLVEAVEYFNNGLFHYRNQRWDKAMTSFREAVSLNPSDKLPQLYIERCAHLKENAPGDDWKGIWVLKTK